MRSHRYTFSSEKDGAMTQPGPFSERAVEFWLGKAVDWAQATTPSARLEVRAHLPKLKIFLRHLLQELQRTRSTTEAMRAFPFVGQFLGRLCWNPCVTVDGESLDSLLQCLWCLYSAQPRDAVERRANQWIQNLLYHLSVGDGAGSAHTAVRRSGGASTDQRSTFLKNMVALLEREVRSSHCPGAHQPERCPCDDVRGASVTCASLVTCPEAAPLIGALLLHPTACDRAALSEDFLEALSAALLGKQLVLEEWEVMSLWCRSLPSLEGAVLNLVESAVSNPMPSPKDLDQQVSDSLLPKASALHCPVLLVINDFFRTLLVETQGNPTVRRLVQAFTGCFLLSLRLLDPQERLPLKAFFPRAPSSLLMPLLQIPSDVPEEAWPEHLSWIGRSLQKVVEEEEEEDAVRRRCCLFESWFLLVQAGYWVDVAAQLLVTSGPEVPPPLLWLLTFYHHPTDLEQHRAHTLTMAGEALDHLRMLFLAPPPLPPAQLQALAHLSSTCPHLLLHLFASYAVFSPGPLSSVSEAVRKVVMVQPGSCRAAEDVAVFLAGVQRGLSQQSVPDPRARSRLRIIQSALAVHHVNNTNPEPTLTRPT
ncbi:hypothetical protein AAFF_G00066370 [Aldrovandia affinis]|uniref:FA complementation group C n=1 Tax=Aldrovandia affinis TaxID=143900 RepID=A0AAD7T406_9TELE|nr:hypothetical protein AAFF_G00066370 [Aldrovandia affinis]